VRNRPVAQAGVVAGIEHNDQAVAGARHGVQRRKALGVRQVEIGDHQIELLERKARQRLAQGACRVDARRGPLDPR
jgi:hypothetical protein